jgi:type I restriction enzyme M protein
LEAIVAMPDQLFYNTGISTYLWIITNRKQRHRKGKIQLIEAAGFFKKMRKSLGNKRQEIGDDQRDEITRLYGNFKEGDYVKIFDNEDFGYYRLTVERPLKLNFAVTMERLQRLMEANSFVNLAASKKRKDSQAAAEEIEAGKQLQSQIIAAVEKLAPLGVVKNREGFSTRLREMFKQNGLVISSSIFKAILAALSERDESADVCIDNKGNPEPDPELRDYENVPLKQDIDEYMAKEVLPHVPDARVDRSKTKVGYEINFNRYFYKYTPPRPLEEIETDLKMTEKEIADMLSEVTE